MISIPTLLAAVALGAAATAPVNAAHTAAVAQAAPVSRIYSAVQNTCLDTSTTDPAAYFLDTYGHPCDNSASQEFTFKSIAGAPARTYEIVSLATGQCMTKYRGAIRQSSCGGAVPPDPASYEWTLEPVGTSGHQYQIALTVTLNGTAQPTCVQVNPQPPGYPGPLFNFAVCNASNAAQVLTLASGL
jgi:hypothetical protein